MSVIGEQIKKFRVQKKYTQEKLGSLIGVTTQAVSKWERGGTPDAEVLPQLADALGVSIDALFGREEQDIQLMLTKKLSKLPADEAYHSAFNICWLIISRKISWIPLWAIPTPTGTNRPIIFPS